ncbi:MAG: GNAT family N-acetyltransferase [Sulfitobacter sp.]
MDTARHKTSQETATLIQETIDRDVRTTAMFAIEFEGRVIGTGGFRSIPEVGYILHPEVWGKGLGTEAMDALITYGFEERGFEEIIADVDPNNAGSIALLTKLGFEETSRAQNTINIDGNWYHSIYFVLRGETNGP